MYKLKASKNDDDKKEKESLRLGGSQSAMRPRFPDSIKVTTGEPRD